MLLDPLILRPPVFPVACVVLGLIVGSFANVVIHRWPRRQSLVFPPSACPGCGRPVRPWDNIPLVSYVLLAGRCRDCRMRIPWRYPAVEAANGLAYGGLALVEGPTPQILVSMAFVTALLVLTLIDLDHQLLPDVITLPGTAVGLAASFLPGSRVSPLGAAGAAAGGYLLFLALAKTYRWTRGVDGLGEGDWKMAAMLGAFLGWERLLLTVFLASLAGTLVGGALMAFHGRTARHRLPLGTFLGAAGMAILFAGDALLAWYKGLWHG